MSMKTRSGVPLQRAYTAGRVAGEVPGEFPFTRGRLATPHTPHKLDSAGTVRRGRRRGRDFHQRGRYHRSDRMSPRPEQIQEKPGLAKAERLGRLTIAPSVDHVTPLIFKGR